MSKKIIRVLICEPGMEPYIKRIEKSVSAIYETLGGEARMIPSIGFNVWHTLDKDIRDVSKAFKKLKTKKFLIAKYDEKEFLASVDSFAINKLSELFSDEDALIVAELKADNRGVNETYISAKRFERKVRAMLSEYPDDEIRNIYNNSNIQLLTSIYYGMNKAFEDAYKVKDTNVLSELTFFIYPIIAETEDGKICLATTMISDLHDWECEDVVFLYYYGVSIRETNKIGFHIISAEDMKNCKFYAVDENVQSKIKSDNNPSDTVKEMIEYVKKKLKGEETNEADVSN